MREGRERGEGEEGGRIEEKVRERGRQKGGGGKKGKKGGGGKKGEKRGMKN